MKMFIKAGKYDSDHKFMEHFKLFCEYCDRLNISGYILQHLATGYPYLYILFHDTSQKYRFIDL
jgi:hypothetical protein